jgi:2-dehydro-3-deoxyphosphooctonate aldolase (KDO 8-P synthase)
MSEIRHIKVGPVTIGNDLPLVLIAGPCQMESREHALEMAEALSILCKKRGIGFIYKSSFDKANRTSLQGKRGLGLEKSLPIFTEIRERFWCPVLSDIHNEEQCLIVAEAVDILQIPAFLSRQTDLLLTAANTGRVLNIKKGQFMAPWDVANILAKTDSCDNPNVMLTERGVSFGYNTLISDMRSLAIMAKTGAPVVFDATHSVQQPGGMGNASGGQREFVPLLARSAVAAKVAAIFIETHEDPDNAPSDGPCMLPLHEMAALLDQLIAIDKLVKPQAYENRH